MTILGVTLAFVVIGIGYMHMFHPDRITFRGYGSQYRSGLLLFGIGLLYLMKVAVELIW